MDLSDVPGIVATYRDNSWRDFAGAIKPDIEGFLLRFEDIARAGSKEDQDVLGSMVRHEAAILKWLDMESRGTRKAPWLP